MTSSLVQEVRKMASIWASEIQQKATANLGKFAGHIRVSAKPHVVGGEQVNIDVVASSPKGDARAYEYGSGIHSRLPNISPMQQGSRGYILIKPKKAKLLAFHWDTMNSIMEEFGEEAVREALRYSHKFKGFAEDGRYLFKYVDHPGVEAANGGKGYVGPAVTSVRPKIRRGLADTTKKEVFGEIKRTFKRTKI